MSIGEFLDPRPVQVGEFTQPLMKNRRAQRARKNPLDKCTIVSIFPKPIDEVKCTIEPGQFHIDAGSYDSPALLIVGSSSWWNDVDIEKPLIEMPQSSVQVADSIIKDYVNGMLAADGEKMPGLFFVLGAKTVAQIKEEFKGELDKANEKQKKWYDILVKLADALWARTNGNPLAIMEDMRIAAKALNLNDKPYLKDSFTIQMVKCVACGSLKHPDFPVCATCKAIDMSHPNAKDLKFAV